MAEATTTSHSPTPDGNRQVASAIPPNLKRPAGVTSALAGALSGIAIGACLQPLDVVRTRMQGDSAQGLTRGTFSTFSSILASQGPATFWRGTSPAVLRMGLGVGLHMMLVENLASKFSKPANGDGSSKLSSINAAAAGGLARLVVSTLLCPMTVIKTRMEYSADSAVRYRSVPDALRVITRAEGLKGLFRGLVPTVLTTAPFSALYYMLYRSLKESLAGPDRPQLLVNFTSGAVAAVGATLLTQPSDVIRTRMQLSRAAGEPAGTLDTLRSALRQSPRTLFIGTLPRVLKRTGQTALVWTLYEELVPWLTSSFAHLSTAVATERQ